MMPMPGMPEPEVEIDAREGGEFTIIMYDGEEKLPHIGKYLEIDRPNKLIFTWESHRSVEDSRVTLIFTKTDENMTNIMLTQVKFIDEQARSDHETGWGNILVKMNKVMS